MLATAEVERQTIHGRGHAEAAAHLRAVRRQVQGVAHRLADRMREILADADQRARDMIDAAADVVSAAEADAQRRREQAESDAQASLADGPPRPNASSTALNADEPKSRQEPLRCASRSPTR